MKLFYNDELSPNALKELERALTIDVSSRINTIAYLKTELTENEQSKLFFEIKQAATNKETTALYLYGVILYFFEEKTSEAINVLIESASSGNANAQYDLHLGYSSYNSYMNFGYNSEESLRWLKQAASGGIPQAMLDVAVHYESTSDFQNAIRYYKQAVRVSNFKVALEACSNLISIYGNPLNSQTYDERYVDDYCKTFLSIVSKLSSEQKIEYKEKFAEYCYKVGKNSYFKFYNKNNNSFADQALYCFFLANNLGYKVTEDFYHDALSSITEEETALWTQDYQNMVFNLPEERVVEIEVPEVKEKAPTGKSGAGKIKLFFILGSLLLLVILIIFAVIITSNSNGPSNSSTNNNGYIEQTDDYYDNDDNYGESNIDRTYHVVSCEEYSDSSIEIFDVCEVLTDENGNEITLSMFTGPGSDYDRVSGDYPESYDEVKFIGFDLSNPEYVMIKFEETAGWVNSEYIRSKTSDITKNIMYADKRYVKVAFNTPSNAGINMREEPSSDSGRVCIIPEGSIATFIPEYDYIADGYMYVKYYSVEDECYYEGWVLVNYTEFIGYYDNGNTSEHQLPYTHFNAEIGCKFHPFIFETDETEYLAYDHSNSPDYLDVSIPDGSLVYLAGFALSCPEKVLVYHAVTDNYGWVERDKLNDLFIPTMEVTDDSIATQETEFSIVEWRSSEHTITADVGLVLRAEPNKESDRIIRIEYDESIRHIGFCDNTEWSFIEYYDGCYSYQGFVFNEYLSNISAPNSNKNEPAGDSSETVNYCGSNVENMIWNFDESTGTLYIEGFDEMSNFSYDSAPWYDLRNSIKKVVIKDGVTSIGSYAFNECSSMESIELPATLNKYGEYAFNKCTGLGRVYYYGDVASWCASAFNRDESHPLGTGATFLIDGEVVSDLIIPEGVEVINAFAFFAYKHLTSISFPSSLKSIGAFAFIACDALENVTFPNSLERLDYGAFELCKNLKTVSFGPSLTYIDSDSFYLCDSITDVYYSGTEEQWNNIGFGRLNDDLTGATLHFNSSF